MEEQAGDRIAELPFSGFDAKKVDVDLSSMTRRRLYDRIIALIRRKQRPVPFRSFQTEVYHDLASDQRQTLRGATKVAFTCIIHAAIRDLIEMGVIVEKPIPTGHSVRLAEDWASRLEKAGCGDSY